MRIYGYSRVFSHEFCAFPCVRNLFRARHPRAPLRAQEAPLLLLGLPLLFSWPIAGRGRFGQLNLVDF